MNSYNSITKRVRRDLEMLYKIEAVNKVDFDIVKPIIRKKHGYLVNDFQAIYIDFRNEKAREAK
ncbi:hypothetical protein H6F44_21185 [Pseudanabaena sp. FACHB-1277]|uniref:Uncharacterized protein n=1 Tax=Pseudanabaena cinerea FACHB-1277 TaxID=2949581 RepID=A0A926Z8E0_9CYAN|nr:hypothetical protein [Pseudanabaena cinerea]MBD2152613.1 hypothetical protein [Pseudanabaena cinerea FACHB-1277]